MPPNADLSQITMVFQYNNTKTVAAPVKAGQVVGTVTANYQGITLASCELVTLTDVESAAPTEPPKQNQSLAQNPSVPAVVPDTGIWVTLKKFWFITIPLLLIFLIICWILILRTINIRKAKKRAQRRRRRTGR